MKKNHDKSFLFFYNLIKRNQHRLYEKIYNLFYHIRWSKNI